VWHESLDALLFHMDSVGVAKAVLIQYFGQFDNSYQTAVQQAHPDRFASIVLVDPDSPLLLDDLDAAMARGARGIRLRPGTRSPGPDSLAIWCAAEERGLLVSCLGSLADFDSDEFRSVVSAVPSLPIVIEHLGSSSWPNLHGDFERSRDGVFGLSRFENVFMKFGGLGEFALRRLVLSTGVPFELAPSHHLRRAYQAFGPSRIMWSSDFSPVSGREGYRNALLWTLGEFSDLAPKEQALIFGGNAESLFFS
jgi:predicted TIM-barrel fold metal-dependent hydrolase